MDPLREPIASQLSSRGLQLQTTLYNTGTCLVYTVIDTRKSLTAVLKLERHSVSGRAEVPQREIDNQLRCQHPNIVQLYDCFWFLLDEQFWIGAIEIELMQKDVARDIAYRRANQFPYTESELFAFLDSMVSALAFAQELKIAHRDIKPHNIFIHLGGYKIGDFGSSKELLEEAEMQSIVGTPSYLSPILRTRIFNKEKFASHNPYKSDVFSLGLTLLHMAELFAISPFGNIEETIEQEITSLRYSDNMKGWLRCMLKIDERDRPDFLTMRKYMKPVEINPFATEVTDFGPQALSQSLTRGMENRMPLSSVSGENLNIATRGRSRTEEPVMVCEHLLDDLTARGRKLPCQHTVCLNCLMADITSLSTTIRIICVVCNEMQEYFRKSRDDRAVLGDASRKPAEMCLKCKRSEIDLMLINDGDIHGMYCFTCVEELYDSKEVSIEGYIDAISQSIPSSRRR